MAKLAALTLARLSLNSISKKRLIHVTNFVIFISLFAISASIISLFYEKKIENLNKQLSNEYANEIIYNHWLATGPRNISNIDDIVSSISTEQNHLIYLQSLNKNLITERELSHNSIKNLTRLIIDQLNSLNSSLNDSILISSSIEDLNKIEMINQKENNLRNEYLLIRKNNEFMIFNFRSMMDKKKEFDLQEIYKKGRLAQSEFILILNKLKKMNIDLNINYYANKKNESEKKITDIKKNIKIYSNKESNLIRLAFIIQLIIFFIIQFFEFSFELVQNVKRKNKE